MEQYIKKQFVAVRAVIMQDQKILIIRESEKYMGKRKAYDFPGGKIQIGETPNEALEREVYEEIGIRVKIGQPFFVDEWRPIVKGEEIQIIGIFFLCKPLTTDIKLTADHDDYQWMPIKEYVNFPLLPERVHAIETLLKMS